MRILLVCPTLISVPPRKYGGIERSIFDLAESLSGLGHNVTLAAVRGSSPPRGVDLIETTKPGTLSDESKAFSIYREHTKNFDVVCDETHTKIASSYREINAYVPVCQTLNLPSFSTPKPCLVSMSKSHSEYIRKTYGYDSRMIYHGINLRKFHPILAWGQKSDRFLFVGTFNPVKGALDAVRFCQRVSAPLDLIEGRMTDPVALKAVRFLARTGVPVGALASRFFRGSFPIGYYADVVASSRSAKVSYRGPLPHGEVCELMPKAKALLFPVTHAEPFGLVVAEALASGTPVIAYRTGSTPELIKNGVTGFLVEPGDADGFLRAMSEIESINPEDCRAHAERHFGSERMATEYVATFEDAINGLRW